MKPIEDAEILLVADLNIERLEKVINYLQVIQSVCSEQSPQALNDYLASRIQLLQDAITEKQVSLTFATTARERLLSSLDCSDPQI